MDPRNSINADAINFGSLKYFKSKPTFKRISILSHRITGIFLIIISSCTYSWSPVKYEKKWQCFVTGNVTCRYGVGRAIYSAVYAIVRPQSTVEYRSIASVFHSR